MLLAALILLAPLLLLIAVCIKLDSPGPALFVQSRVGSRRRAEAGTTRWDIITFPCYKFRSMMHNADPALHQAHIKAFVEAVVKARPSGAKGTFVKRVAVTSSMGPGVKVDPSSVLPAADWLSS